MKQHWVNGPGLLGERRTSVFTHTEYSPDMPRTLPVQIPLVKKCPAAQGVGGGGSQDPSHPTVHASAWVNIKPTLGTRCYRCRVSLYGVGE